LPADLPTEVAVGMLRDLKALATGQGEVSTTAGRAALPPGEPRLPAGLKPLLPEGSDKGWRPPVQGKASEGLPPLEEVTQQVGKLRDNLLVRLEKEREARVAHLQPHLTTLQEVGRQLGTQAEREQKVVEQLEQQLDRPLRALERLRVRNLLN